MKIAYVIDRLEAGGAERVAVDLANLMVAEKHYVSFVLFVKGGAFEKDLNEEINIFYLNRKKKFSIKKMKVLSRYLDEYDIVHIHMRHVFRYIMIVKLLFPFSAKMVFHDHSSNTNKTFRNFSFKYLTFNIDAYIGTSQELCNWAKTYLNIPEKYVWKLTNISIKQSLEQNNSKISKVLLSFIMVSNIRKEKNIEFLIKFIDLIKTKYTVKLDIYGQNVDNEYFNKLLQLIDKYNLSDDIHFVTDCINVQKELYRYDMAFHCAKFETGPLVLIEYLSQGLPFLSYQTGEVVKIVKKYFPEMVIDNFNIYAWEKKTDLVLDNLKSDETRKQLIEIYEKHFSEKEYLDQCIKIYKTVLSS